MLSKTKLPTEVSLQKKLHDLSYGLRNNPTRAEDYLWVFLRKRRLLGLRFLRQHPIDRFIVDFVCYEKKLVIEVDGPIHLTQKEKDKNRDKILGFYGFRVIRFTNAQVMDEMNDVLSSIMQYISLPSMNYDQSRWR